MPMWQLDGELGTGAGFGLDGDPAAMGFDDGLDEAESEAEAALGTAFVTAIEAVPDTVVLGLGDADPVVADADEGAIGSGFGGEADGATDGGVLEGVVEKVGEDLADAVGIDGGRAGIGKFGSDLDLFFFGDEFVEFDDFPEELAEVHRLEVESHHAGFGLGDVHEGIEDAEDAFGFLDAIGEGVMGLLGGSAGLEGEFGGAAESGERGPEIVGGVVEGFAHGADESLIAVEDGVEVGDEFGEFTGGGWGGNPGIETAGEDDGAGGLDDLADGAGSAMGEEGAAGEADEDDGRPDEEESAAEGFEQDLTVVGAATDLEDGAVGQRVGGDGEIAFGIARDADNFLSAFEGPDAIGERDLDGAEFDPFVGDAGEGDVVAGGDEADEEGGLFG